ncbi:alpha/beta hydrolase [Herbiconiux sp. CPCC 205763]|uniref:Alpha/beta hydrolase n=1 Tax=Herbiconiux aconitum TaxID=2970913 RepID=A0ABT2GMB7_9MICO|nr:alpha/beta hydrolase [Herbiconiux aconitum]MCS5717370.1 alpha/beta hydrolase [Herbiconiux aconitum]
MTTIAPGRSRWSWASIKNAGFVQRLPVWVWRLLMHTVSRSERTRFNVDPITAVDYRLDIDFVGDGIRAHRLDVISPRLGTAGHHPATPLPVYVYFHGGGWTSGDKDALTKYCASQALGGMVVVNVNYRRATQFTMSHMVHDANAALAWVSANIADFGGDPERIVLGGDSAGGQLSALLAAAHFRDELADHYDITPAVPRTHLRGLVQHCSVVDFSVMFERGFILGLGFIRMLLPGPLRSTRSRGELRRAADYLSPIEWLDSEFPPVFVTTSERDYFYTANLNFIARLREHQVRVDALIYDRDNANTLHTWQQNYRYPESQEVYQRLQHFVREVTGTTTEPGTGHTLAGSGTPASR